jgi:hypothetical protein
VFVIGFSVGDSLGFEPAIEETGSKRRSAQDGRSANIGVQTFAAQHMAVSDMGPASGRSVLSDSEPIILPNGTRKTRRTKKNEGKE